MMIEGKLYKVYREYPEYPDVAMNEVIVCASNENQAKGIALDKFPSMLIFTNKKHIFVKELENIKIGDIL